MLKSIFWDNDGVLVDTERLYYQANKMVLESVGIELTKKMYLEYFLIKSSGAWHLADHLGFSQEKLDYLRDARNELFSELICKEKMLLDGVLDTVRVLSAKYKMCIVTGSRRDHFELIHRSTNILQYFDFVLTVEDFIKMKPDPESYLMALKRSGFNNEECLIIEDSERGLAAARAAGIKCIVIPHELSRDSNFSGAHAVLDSITKLITML